ncbi:dual specificity protein phosphatase PHS1 isoform X3 [Citrus clementina]|uniref:dual specificity protein phosphatase PHS1 isoform X3 n=1 Tax=Citrus clementina TaxID=85681 RepID=UPI000CED4F6F|nr:dual specificity protein phosphatase PHS1 isoform X3 [Citrus x clementina]
MAKELKELAGAIIDSTQEKDEDKELDFGSDESEPPLPLTATSRVLYMLGDITAGPAYRFTQWLELVRKRSAKYRSSGFPHRPYRLDTMPVSCPPLLLSSARESLVDPKGPLPTEQPTENSLWERLGKASMLDIESSLFSWDMLSSLHHTEHSSSTDQSEDELNKALEVTVNSGGVVFFALFNQPGSDDAPPKEAAAVIKFSSSRMATQSERLGYEFAKWLGVQTPQARVIHNCSSEWLQIKEAAEKARATATSEGDEIGEMTCSELLEALELSRCLFLMSYVHGSPLLESSSAFESRETAEKTAAALGRVLMLDLVIRNEDRLPCRQLRWRGNPANLLLADKMASANMDAMEEAFDSAIKKYRPRVIRALQKERRTASVDSRVIPHSAGLVSEGSDLSDIIESPKSSELSRRSQTSDESTVSDFHIVAIDSGVPRRPPAGKRANDQANYPKLVELLLNSSEYASNLLHEITGGKLGSPPLEDASTTNSQLAEMTSVVQEFRSGFRAALRDLQGFHIFLITLYQKLDGSLRAFLNILNKAPSGDFDKEDYVAPESPSQSAGSVYCQSPPSKERLCNDSHPDYSDTESQKTAPRSSSKESTDSNSPMSRENWHGKFCKGNGEHVRSLRLTAKLRDFHKFAKVDAESNKELEQWNEMLRNDAVKLCQENNFNTGFFEGSDGVVDAYELKISDNEDTNISSIFEEASDFIDHVEQTGGRVLVHCFEGRSRSATLVLAYLMLRKNFTLLQAWNTLKRVHRRAQPNDGFAKILLELDRKLHGEVSMEWQQRKPMMKVCPICGKNAGLSSSSLKLHLQKSHKKLSSGSVDSAMTMEIQKALDALKISRGGSVSPTQRESSSLLDE